MKGGDTLPIPGGLSHCDERARIIVSQDRGSKSPKHIAHNPSRALVYQYKIDGEVISEGARCDYLVMNENQKTAYLIELKGSDLVHAAEQLAATVEKLFPHLTEYGMFYRIIANRCNTQAIESVRFKKYRAQWGKALMYKTGMIEESIS